MIARVGFFEQFDFDDREFVLEVIGSMPGFRGVYHLVDRDSGETDFCGRPAVGRFVAPWQCA